jgi:hypothetical protein
MDRKYENWTLEDLQLLLRDLERMVDEAYGNGQTQRMLAEAEAELREREF